MAFIPSSSEMQTVASSISSVRLWMVVVDMENEKHSWSSSSSLSEIIEILTHWTVVLAVIAKVPLTST